MNNESAAVEARETKLRELIASVEWQGATARGFPCCPWCKSTLRGLAHEADCPAFAAPGKLRAEP